MLACLSASLGCRALSKRETKDISMARSLSLRGFEALQQKKFDDAESLFVEALRRSPHDERAQQGYSEVLWQRGQRDAAIEHMAKAVALSESNPDLWVRLGQMHLEQGDYARARENADAALRNRRADPAAWALKADVHRCTGQTVDAISCYQRALFYRPDWPEVQVTVAELYLLTHPPQRALATLDRMTDKRSETQVPPRAYLVRAQALADLGEREAAIMCLRSASGRLAPDQSELLYEFAAKQLALGDLVEARLCLGRVLQREPNHALAQQLQTELDGLLSRPNDPKVPAVTVGYPMPGKEQR